MRWIRTWWRRRRNGEADTARQMRSESERKLREAERMGAEVRAVAARLTWHLEQNNFSAMVAAVFRGRR